MKNYIINIVIVEFAAFLFSCSCGDGEALLLKNGNVVDGQTRRIICADVLVRDGVIAEVGENIADKDCRVIDCTGKTVTAGYVDAHVHIESSMVLPFAFGEAVLPHGTTTVIADPHEIVNVAGAEGLRFFLDAAAQSPIDIFTVVPSSVPATPYDTNGAGEFLAEDMREFVPREDVVGLGEVMCFGDVVARKKTIMDKIALFRQAGKTIDGHTAGMPDSMLDAYISAGVSDDHECSDVQAMMERYNRGMNIYVREGSAARNARELLEYAFANRLDTSKFAFCTDDKHLATIAVEGHISYIVAMARAIGFDWGAVAQMASYNPCRYYGLAKRGNIRKGYKADIVVTNDEGTTEFYVIKDGRVVACDGQLTEPKQQHPAQPKFENTVKFRDVTAADFVVPQSLHGIALALTDGQLLTSLAKYESEADWEALPMLANIERHGKRGNIAVCKIAGYGIRGGAVATSVSHDSHNVICVGDNAADMALACNMLKTIGGGYVIARNGEIIGELPMPAFGLMSVLDAQTTSQIIAGLDETAHMMGVNPNIDAFTTLSFVALPVIPSVRLLDTGLFDVDNGKFIE